MGLTVKDMMEHTMFRKAQLLGGENGLDKPVLGATIIETPDILRFINGGEVLLTGFYAFQHCTLEEFESYIHEIVRKKVSALVFKRVHEVEEIEEKIAILLKYAEESEIPVMEIPYEVSYRDILEMIMEHLFNEEVIRLKYFKTTHDNFTALSLSFHSMENGLKRILDVLDKLIGNPVALYNQNMDCLATTNEELPRLSISDNAKEYTPDFYSNYTYLKQEVCVNEETNEMCGQYLVRLNVMYNARMYLVITELNESLGSMDYIAVENAVTALKQELFRQHSLVDLEKSSRMTS